MIEFLPKHRYTSPDGKAANVTRFENAIMNGVANGVPYAQIGEIVHVSPGSIARRINLMSTRNSHLSTNAHGVTPQGTKVKGEILRIGIITQEIRVVSGLKANPIETQREMDVAGRIVAACVNDEICKDLKLTLPEVRDTVEALLRKTKSRSREHLAAKLIDALTIKAS